MAKKETFYIDSSAGNPFAHSMTSAITVFAGQSGSTVNNSYSDTFIRVGEAKAGVRNTAFIKFRLNTVPPRSRIISAKLRLQARGSYTTAYALDVACLASDNKWDHRYISPDNVSFVASSANEKMLLTPRDGTTNLGGTGIVAGDLDTTRPIRFSFSDAVIGTTKDQDRWGQVLKIDTTGSLTNVVVSLNKTGSPSGNARITLYAVNSSYEPVGDALALSDTKLWSVLVAGQNQFNFTGDQIKTVTSGEAYFFEVRTRPTVEYSSSNYGLVQVDQNHSGLDNDERVFGKAAVSGFSTGNYPQDGQLPFLYSGNTGTTIHKSPHGDIITVTLPTTSNDEYAELSGLENLVQQWIDSPRFIISKRVMGFVLESADHFATNSNQDYDNIELVLEYQPRNIMIT